MKLSPSLASLVASANTRDEYAQKIIQGLGVPAARRLCCFQDSNPNATDPFTTGTEFLNIGLTGEMEVTDGDITGWGSLSGATVKNAADLATGACVMRVVGNNPDFWIEGTVGLAGSSKEFIFSANPAAGNSTGIGFLAGCGLKSPSLLSTGVGPVAPQINKTAPAAFRIIDWTDAANPVVVDTIPLDTRAPNLVMEDTEILKAMGDVRITKSSKTIVFDKFEFGVMMFSLNAVHNAEANLPVHQVLVNCKPFATPWAEKYPSYTTYSISTDITHPPAFKGELIDGNGNVCHVFEMRDGLPINDPSLAQNWSATVAARPFFTCAMMLFYQSHELKESKYARKYFNGFREDILRPSTCKQSGSTNAWIVQTNDSGQHDGSLQWNALPQWPMPSGKRNAEDYPFDVDPYLYDADTATGNGSGQYNRGSGWDYEPGSISGHDWYSGPGGVRADRCIVPPALGYYMTKPDGVRLKGNVPFKKMKDAWNKAYFNHSRHWFEDVRNFRYRTKPYDVYRGQWAFAKSYYNGSTSGLAPTPENHVMLNQRGNQSSTVPRDSRGLRPWNGRGIDYMHSYNTGAWPVLMENSAAHVVSAMFSSLENQITWFGGGRPAIGNYLGRFHSRQDAYNWFQTVMAWKLASKNPDFGISREVIEDRIFYMLNSMYETVYLPTINGDTRIEFECIRNLGTPGHEVKNTTIHRVGSDNSSMAYYIAGVFQLMKTFGLWDRLWNHNQKYRDLLTWWIGTYDKYSLDFAIDTDIRYDYYMPITKEVPLADPLPPIPKSWKEWGETVWPKTGVEDWVTNPDGTTRTIYIERDGNTHLRAQYAFMRRDFDLYVPNPKIEVACAKYQGWYDKVAANVELGVTARNKTARDWIWRWPGNGIYMPTIDGE